MAVGIPGVQTAMAKYHFPLKGTRTLWRNGCFSNLGQEINRMGLELLSHGPQGSCKVGGGAARAMPQKDPPTSLKRLLLAKGGRFEHH